MVKLVAPIALFAVAVATATDPFNWKPCPGSKDPQLQCGALTVPLDHLDPSANQTIDIAVARYRTNSTTPKGTILLNPGGPGGPGVSMASLSLLKLTGGQYDVLGFDPRGVGQSHPIQCAKNSYTAAQDSQLFDWLDLPFDTDKSGTSLARLTAFHQATIRRCEKYTGTFLQYLSTSFVARDMDLIRAALGESVLNYYGFSYGTFLGLTYVNLFPDRVGRIAIDGVLDPTYYTGPTPDLMLQSTYDLEDIVQGFTSACEAEPSKCPLADKSGRMGYVWPKLQALFDQANDSPLIVPTAAGDVTVLTGTDIRRQIKTALGSPVQWRALALKLSQLINGTYVADAAAETCPAVTDTKLDRGRVFAAYVAHDGDNSAAMTIEEAINVGKSINSEFGIFDAIGAIVPLHWKTKPIERYAGPWDKPLKQPILIVSNQLDPRTPLKWAQNTAELLGDNAVLATRDGYGHCTISMPSRCIQQITIDFFTNGTYPEADTNCRVDVTPFGTPLPTRAGAEAVMPDVEEARQEVAKLLPMTWFGF
ncbi:Aste57867_3252 [Aphanomyces stellatus]|uniref:Aste57867_3252 protein n=1 Tax=Aphanomyces stellatus TaxID=120398 RepID=A0A485KES0_9STRA|nr:hypothetical protein As57867_003242 [Aphanomyces stellatus]VFT80425.1 Aste57867_3252 [Aphanomyces stellatus]